MKKISILDRGFFIWFDKKKKKEYYITPIAKYDIDCINKEDICKIIYNSNSSNNKCEKNKVKENDNEVKSIPYVNSYEESIGSFLIKFLNADFTNSEKAYSTFFCFYGLEIMKEYKIKDKVIPENKIEFKNKSAFKKYFDEVFSITSPSLVKLQKRFKEYVDCVYCLNDHKNDDGNPNENLFMLKLTNTMEKYSKNVIPTFKMNFEDKGEYDIPYKFLPFFDGDTLNFNNDKTFYSEDISSICYLVLNVLVNNNLKIKICKHCGRYFVPMRKSAEIYCELDPIDSNGKKCIEFGARIAYANNIKDNEALLIYRRTYQKKTMEISRNPDSVAKEKEKKKFIKWRKEAQEKIKEFKAGKLTEDGLYNWMVKSKGK